MSEDEIKQNSESDVFAGEGGDDVFDDFESGEGKTLGGFFKNPAVKTAVVTIGVLSVVVGLVLFGGKKEKKGFSILRANNADVDQAPGTTDVSPAMREAIEDVNKKAAEEAERNQGSAIPIPVQPMSDRVKLSDDDGNMPEDPLERWRRIQEERQKRQGDGKTKAQVDPNAEAIDALAKAISAQMGQILQAQKFVEIVHEKVAPADYLEELRESERSKLEKGGGNQDAADSSGGKSTLNILLPAGTLEYAQLITEANSDVPGPVMAQIVTGPLAGSRILGSFKAKDEYLVIEFKTVVIDGISTSVDAVALDPDTTLPGMVTDIDHKYFQRIIIPAAAKFVEGMSGAIADAGSTTVVVDSGAAVQEQNDLGTKEEAFKGISEAVGKVSEVLDEDSQQIKPMIRVASGTPMSILFVEPVIESTQAAQ